MNAKYSDNTPLVSTYIDNYRKELLDLSKRNKLISFKHSDKSHQHIRIIDAVPEDVFARLCEDEKLIFQPLPRLENDGTPKEEKTAEFQQLLEYFIDSDEEYIRLTEAGEDNENIQVKLEKREQELRDAVRRELGLSPRPHSAEPVGDWAKKALKTSFSQQSKRLSNKEIAKEFGINPDYNLPFPATKTEEYKTRQQRALLQILLKPAEMERKLSQLSSYIRTDDEESGVNTLYAAFFFLEHYETESSDTPIFSPLLLMPLEINKEKTQSGYRFSICSTGDEAELNQCLAELLKQNFGIKLPEFNAEEHSKDNILSYCNDFQKIIQTAENLPQRAKWRLRRFMTVGRFHFARLVMYHDLNDANWATGNGLIRNPIIASLLTKTTSSGDAHYAQDHDIDALESQGKAPLLITAADASQHSAIADVMRGGNLAIQGPPGTGKSQTIANIIANALANDKKVLFLAEKMAALNVVHERLNHAGLGVFCLELHSAKARKTEILKSIKERLDLRQLHDNSAILREQKQEFIDRAADIRRYADALNMVFGNRIKTVYEYLWALQRQKGLLDTVIEAQICQAAVPFAEADLSENQIERLKKQLSDLSAFKKALDIDSGIAKHPWSFIKNFSMDSFTRKDCKNELKNWQYLLQQTLLAAAETMQGEEAPQSAADWENFLAGSRAALTYDIQSFDYNCFANIDSLAKAVELAKFVCACKELNALQAEIHIPDIDCLSENIIQQIEQSIQIAKALSVETLFARDLEEAGERQERILQILERGTEILKSMQSILGLEHDLTLEQVGILLRLPRDIEALPREYLPYRTEKILSSASRQCLQKASEIYTHIQKEEADIAVNFDINMVEDLQDIANQAAFFEQPKSFPYLSSSYRRAKKDYKNLRKNRNFPGSAAAAKDLWRIAGLLRARAEIEGDKELAMICGTAFPVADTDLEALRQTNLWADRIRKIYSSADSFSDKIRALLFESAPERLEALRDLSFKDIFPIFLNTVTELRQQNNGKQSYWDLIEIQKERREYLFNLYKTLRNIAGTATVNFHNLEIELETLKKTAALKAEIESNETARILFGANFNGIKTNINAVAPIAEFITLCIKIPVLRAALQAMLGKDFLAHWHEFQHKIQDLTAKLEAAKAEGEALRSRYSLDFSAYGTVNWQDIPMPQLRDILAEATAKPNTLNSWLDYNNTLSSLPKIATNLVTLYEEQQHDFATLPIALEYSLYYATAKEIYRRHPEVQQKGRLLETARATIKELTEQLFQLHRKHIAAQLSLARPLIGNNSGYRKTWTEDALLYNEIEKVRRHIPIRDLMRRAGKSVQRIKPCFLMSPLTVAQYLAPGTLEFDLLVIDEASQMRPEEALGGIARAKQIVVVGDPKQLPPTSFFQAAGHDDETEEENLRDDDIMQLALTAYRPARILTRHYRSRHESLIAFSNYHFYENKLVLFPSPQDNQTAGLQSRYIGGRYKNSVNPAEVKAIVQATLNFMQNNPNHSLGIATMNQAQQSEIEMAMDKAFMEHDYAEEYRLQWRDTLEPFFIKNLENVQGDERDSIFISTVYGPDENGAIMQRFGPINQTGGERRLNVLFSRAKQNMTVFTSLHPEDIKITETSSKGLHAFKGFLAYAHNRHLDMGKGTQKKPDSDFELWVKEKLESIGCEVIPQVGVSGFRIDLGVKHQDYPYGYLVGIECDGAAYHSSKSARERDVIRQQVLEGLGWNIYRIWSSDWFADPFKEFEKLKHYIRDKLQETSAALPPLSLPDNANIMKENKIIGDSAKITKNNAQTERESLLEKTKNNDKEPYRANILDKIIYWYVKKDGSKDKRAARLVDGNGDPTSGTVSKDSEIGKALLNCQKQDELSVLLPFGEVKLIIEQIIKYEK